MRTRIIRVYPLYEKKTLRIVVTIRTAHTGFGGILCGRSKVKIFETKNNYQNDAKRCEMHGKGVGEVVWACFGAF